MAADAVDAVVEQLGRGGSSRTRRLRLLGSAPATHAPEHLARRYGSEAAFVLSLLDADPALAAPLVPGLPYLRAEAVHGVRREMARTLDDVLSRRTRARLLGRDATAAAADDVAGLLAPELGWSDDDRSAEAAVYRAAVAHERESAGLPETALDRTLGA
ncbi:MAG: hypothetical protein M5U14_14635 [Acidimicrobiia bacterium]|nr:hypothetical protein [Acidimicrobiia bacterium]